MYQREKKVETIAVHKLKLEGLLKSLELWDEVQKGSITCELCSALLSLDNISMIVPSGNEIHLYCSEIGCIQKSKDISEDSEDEN